MKQNIWIINHYAGDTYFDKGGRHYWMSKWLSAFNYKPVVFCCNNKHNPGTEEWFDTTELWIERIAEETKVPYVFVRGRRYIGNGKQRVFNMIDFYQNVKKTAIQYIKNHNKPDIIYASSVHPLTLVAGIQLAKKFGVKCICEIRDLWPESLIDYNIAKRGNIFVILLRKLEKWIYIKADALVFTMEGAYDYIVEQGWEKEISQNKVFCVNNGVDIETFDYYREKYCIKDKELENTETIKIVYTGSIRKVNNLGKLIDIAKKVKNPKIRFLIWGDGDELDILKRRIVTENIFNTCFKGRVEKKYIPYITSQADFNFAHNDESPLFRFGISFNKIFDYFAAGQPIICDFDSQYNPVIIQHAGVEVNGDSSHIANEIDIIASLDTSQNEMMSRNARNAAETYSVKNLTRKIINIVESL